MGLLVNIFDSIRIHPTCDTLSGSFRDRLKEAMQNSNPISIMDLDLEGKKIAILGPQESGKTELWCALQNKPRTSIVTTSNEPIEKFCLGSKSDGTKVYVEKTQDIGGSDKYASLYDRLVTEGTFVCFVLDITKIECADYRQQPLVQFLKIREKCSGYIILATHIDKYRGDRSQGLKVVRDYFAPLEAYGIDRTTLNVKLVNLKNANDIQEIRKEVLMSLN